MLQSTPLSFTMSYYHNFLLLCFAWAPIGVFHFRPYMILDKLFFEQGVT